MAHHDRFSVRRAHNGMRRIGWNDTDETRSRPFRAPAGRDVQLALQHMPNLFLRMEMLRNRRTSVEFIMRKCHIDGVEVATAPAGLALYNRQFARVDKRHVRVLKGAGEPITLGFV